MADQLPLQNELITVTFFLVIWLSGLLMGQLKSSPLLGYILVGTLLGPALANIVPYPEAFILLGTLGVMFFVVESGLDLRFDQVKDVGVRAFVAASLGVIGPMLLVALFVGGVYAGASIATCVAAGAALAPTSMGFSAQMLNELGELNTDFGTLVTVTAIFDDVISIVVLAEIQAIGGVSNGTVSDVNVGWTIAAPIVGSVLSILIGLAFASKCGLPSGLAWVQNKLPWEQGSVDKTMLLLLMCLSAVYAFICAAIGSSQLLGCFLAGLTFSSVFRVQRTWGKFLGPFVKWGLRLFFASTIGFDIPPLLEEGGMFSDGNIVLSGLVIALLAIFGKMTLGVCAVPAWDWVAMLKFGLAMNGRGEFSFLIASYAFNSNLLDKALYSAVILGSILASFITPFAYRLVVHFERRSRKDDASDCGDVEQGDEDEDEDRDGDPLDDQEQVLEDHVSFVEVLDPTPPPPKVRHRPEVHVSVDDDSRDNQSQTVTPHEVELVTPPSSQIPSKQLSMT